MRSRWIFGALGGLALVIGANPVRAAQDDLARDVRRGIVALNREASTDAGEREVASLLAAEFHVSSDDVEAQRKGFRFTYGDLAVGHALAGAAKREMTALALEYLRGKGWDQIAAELGVSLEPAKVFLDRVRSKIAGRPAMPGPPAYTPFGTGGSR